MKLKPWRCVLTDPAPTLRSGRGGLLGPDTTRRTRWWDLRLECGHTAERTVRYRPLTEPEKVAAGWNRERDEYDVLPPPKRVRCDRCGAAA